MVVERVHVRVFFYALVIRVQKGLVVCRVRGRAKFCKVRVVRFWALGVA